MCVCLPCMHIHAPFFEQPNFEMPWPLYLFAWHFPLRQMLLVILGKHKHFSCLPLDFEICQGPAWGPKELPFFFFLLSHEIIFRCDWERGTCYFCFMIYIVSDIFGQTPKFQLYKKLERVTIPCTSLLCYLLLLSQGSTHERSIFARWPSGDVGERDREGRAALVPAPSLPVAIACSG